MRHGARPATIEIDHSKLVDYLLNVDHPTGGSKARFLLGQGFLRSEPKRLADALFEHLGSETSAVIEQEHPGGYGITHISRGPMPMPNGTTKIVLTIWLGRRDTETVRFVTAYPA